MSGGAAPAGLSPEVIECFRLARSILFITGAGLSADSGLPTYRGIGGLYDADATDEGLAIEDALSGTMLRARPDICWKYLLQIESACRGARPNRAHEVIAAFEADRPGVWVLTQNVDGLHRAAGSKNVIEIHGEVNTLLCTRCTWTERRADWAGLVTPPVCPSCGAPVRPNVVLFGEMLPHAAMRTYARVLQAGFDLVVSIGTTSVFPYISGPVVEARKAEIPTVEINPGDTEVSHVVRHRVRLGAAAALDAIWAALRSAGPA
jgi:NAD-dependent deacetylase